MKLIEFETSVTDFGGFQSKAQIRYWPTTEACQIRKRYLRRINIFRLKEYWSDWRWLSSTHERQHYLSQPNVQKEINAADRIH